MIAPATDTVGHQTDVSKASRDLAAASIVASVLAYVLVVLGTRAFGADDFASVSLVWSWWMLCAAVVTFPLQHWVIRSQTAGESIGKALRASLGLTVLAGGTAGVTVNLLSGDVFAGSPVMYGLIIGATPVGSWCIGVSRAALVGRGQVRIAALSIGLENVIRLGAGLIVVLSDLTPEAFALSIPAGFLVAALAVRKPGGRMPAATHPAVGVATGRAALGGLFFASVVNQVVQSGTPLVPPVVGGSDDDITVVFVLLLLARIPYFLVNTIMIGWTDRLTTLFVQNQRRELVDLLRRATLGLVAGLVAVGISAPWFGAALIRFAFGDDLAVTAIEVTLFAFAGVATVALLVLLLLLVAAGRPWWAAGASTAGAILGAGTVAIRLGSPTVSAGVMFLTSVGTGAALAAVAVGRFLPPEKDAVT